MLKEYENEEIDEEDVDDDYDEDDEEEDEDDEDDEEEDDEDDEEEDDDDDEDEDDDDEDEGDDDDEEEDDYEDEDDDYDDLPQEWIDLLEEMPDIKEQFMEDKELNEYNTVPEYFFSYFEKLKDSEPFFTCFEGGQGVFDNFYELYGSWDDEEDEEEEDDDDSELSDDEILELVKKHIESLKYFLSVIDLDRHDYGKDYFDFDNVEVKIMNSDEYAQISDEVDKYRDKNVRNLCSDAMLDKILPNEDDNPIMAFDDALFEQTQNDYILYYILWPLGGIKDIENPFAPYEKLWEYGVDIRFVSKNLIAVVR